MIHQNLIQILQSHLLDQFPEDCDFVIALGHKGNLVKEFLETLYPHKKIEFVFVEPYKGEKSGLGHTLQSSSHLLQEPFVFISCDTWCHNFSASILFGVKWSFKPDIF